MQNTRFWELPAQRNSISCHPLDVLIDDGGDRAAGGLPRLLALGVQRLRVDFGIHRRPRIPADDVNDAWPLLHCAVYEWLKEPVQAGRLEVPVGDQYPPAVGREDPGQVRERHRSSRSALERVERDDLAFTRWLPVSLIRHLTSPPTDLVLIHVDPAASDRAGWAGSLCLAMTVPVRSYTAHCDTAYIAVRPRRPAPGRW